MIGYSLGCTDDKLIGSDEGIKLGFSDGEVVGTILGNVDGITHGIDVRTDLSPLYVSFDGYNDVKLEGSFLGD